LTLPGRVEALLCGVICLRKRGQRAVTLVFFFHQEFFELKRRDVAERRMKALGIQKVSMLIEQRPKKKKTKRQRK
jgi:hypothetical protein